MPKVKELADYKDRVGWTGTTKGWNYHKPLHRINGPTPPSQPDGRGLDCGCRNESEAPVGEIASQMMRGIPNWVPVHPKADVEREVEGILLRSIHSYTDSPFTQWHRWYDWNFHIDPAPGFEGMLGPANTTTALSGSAAKLGFDQPVIRAWYEPGIKQADALKRVMECEWDLGGFAGGRSAVSNGVLFRQAGSIFETDWAWPMTGQYIWLAGRWIYDCGHPQPIEKMHTELHPCKAVATARWEAVQFPENGNLFVPGIQFMFFASRWGGYHNFPTIHDQDYEFIVDLPIPAVPAPVEYSIGHTPDFPLNTAVLRWDLLKKFDHRVFENAIHDPSNIGLLNPIPAVSPRVELVEPFNPQKPQAKITIPLKSAKDQLANLNAYGVIISMGWRDPDKSQARRVKKCRILLENFHADFVAMKERKRIPDQFLDKDNGPATWRVRIGVNGRWFAIELNDVHPFSDFKLQIPELVLHLSEDDGIHFSASGFVERRMGKFMTERDLDVRTLRFMLPGVPVRFGAEILWERDVVGIKGKAGNLTTFAVAESFKQRGEEVIDFPHTDENFPLGFVDPYVNSDENPLRVDQDLPPTPKLLTAPYSLEAPDLGVENEPGQGDLVEKSDMLEYFIQYTVSIEPQKV